MVQKLVIIVRDGVYMQLLMEEHARRMKAAKNKQDVL